MTTARDTIKFMRRLGIVLITLPEAVTTPFGVALLLGARYLSKRLEANLYERLRGTFQHYLAHTTRRPVHNAGKSGVPGKVERSARSEPRPIPIPVKNNNAKDESLPLNWQSQRKAPADVVHHAMDWKKFSPHYGTIAGAKLVPSRPASEVKTVRFARLIHHEIDIRKLSRRFRVDDNSAADSGSAVTADEVLVNHSLSTRFIARHYETANLPPAPPKYHTIDMASLQRRFGAPALR
ncbi:MAG: hypothetical protein HYX80_00160 [Chloroflexi bacterium]|nr:hypothetical protein [Chloroflexota bacterium]